MDDTFDLWDEKDVHHQRTQLVMTSYFDVKIRVQALHFYDSPNLPQSSFSVAAHDCVFWSSGKQSYNSESEKRGATTGTSKVRQVFSYAEIMIKSTAYLFLFSIRSTIATIVTQLERWLLTVMQCVRVFLYIVSCYFV